MTRARTIGNLAVIVLPLAGVALAGVLLWGRMVGPVELVILGWATS